LKTFYTNQLSHSTYFISHPNYIHSLFMYNIEELKIRLLSELREIAEELGVKNYKTLKKDDLIYAILDQQAITPEKSLPKKKPSKIEQEAPEAENSPKEETPSQQQASTTPEKPKFKRQN